MLSKVLKEFKNIGFTILAIVSDSKCVNKKAFILFFPNKIPKPYIQHPNDPLRQLFFSFDIVNILNV